MSMKLHQSLSPQQILLSSLLQLPTLLLEQRLKQELELNPLLEESLETEEIAEMELEQQQDKDESDETETDTTEEEIDWDTILNDEDNYQVKTPRDNSALEDQQEIPTPARTSLYDYLLQQLSLAPLTPEQYVIGEYIIWNIDENGYLGCPTETISIETNTTLESVEAVLKTVQGFDPVGIGARNLRECLLMQLRRKGLERHNGSNLAIQIVKDYFDEFKNRKYEVIQKKLDVHMEEIKHAIAEISALDPKPGEGYLVPELNYVTPDVIIRKVDDDFEIILNDSTVPLLKINARYAAMLRSKNVDKQTKAFIKNKFESAKWFIDSIHQRRATILKTVHAIAEKQRAFFEEGPEHLKPMILKDIANEIGMDISTISRVTNGKYAQTDYGVFELKYFFTEGMTTTDGEDVSTRTIKNELKTIVENENHKKPLSDDLIAKYLKEKGYPIARRTVAKYREQLNIPSARLRRQI